MVSAEGYATTNLFDSSVLYIIFLDFVTKKLEAKKIYDSWFPMSDNGI
jgi:hypothetical protein